MSEQVWWYATRAAGLMTWATATASVVVGLMLSTRAIRARTGPWFLDLHRFLGGISVVFLIAHVATLWADSYVDFGPRELFVPGASEWRSEAIAWGIIGAYLLIAIEVSSLLRSRISLTLWRVIHFLSFAAMVAGSYHAWLAGSDVKNPITWAIAGTGSLLVLGLVAMRLQRQDPDDPGPTGLSDNRAILEEMRRRLEELPIPESMPQPELALSQAPILPRRAPTPQAPAPLTDAPSTETPAGPTGPVGFSDDPFAAVPLRSPEPELGNWAAPSPADPFAAQAPQPPDAPGGDGPSGPWARDTAGTIPGTSPGTSPDLADSSNDGADLFVNIMGDPFEALGVAPARSDDGFPELPPLSEPADLFASPGPSGPSGPSGDTSAPAPSGPSGPFDPVTPAAPTAATSSTASTTLQTGPPPLPDAVDPVTGEPDEAAYTQWLKEWLAYAEKYGDEAPDDPSRI